MDWEALQDGEGWANMEGGDLWEYDTIVHCRFVPSKIFEKFFLVYMSFNEPFRESRSAALKDPAIEVKDTISFIIYYPFFSPFFFLL